MSINGFFLIIASALSHVLWNTFLKGANHKPSAILLMMVVAVVLMGGHTLWVGETSQVFHIPIVLAALVSGFFFFLYQYCVALAYGQGDLSQVYPLTITAPIYIAIWSYFFLGEHVSLIGFGGICLLLYGAVTIQTGTFRLHWRTFVQGNIRHNGVLMALLAAFVYSFGAIADKVGVGNGAIAAYTFDVCLFMLVFHCIWMVVSNGFGRVVRELQEKPTIAMFGGIAMMVSFITFRSGLVEMPASYAAALRQVSTLFGVALGFFIFRETFGIKRIMSALLIVVGAVLIRLG
ncbi:DMT family transporter [Chrysiogenes arsenatis]|uniref:DMT family transporter n=1 Tax=Chrysiogenes arsenatis TaxID=309797 RepID=UPI0003F6F348|nr:EamA family transporter [Chrysiogenes arsenatis]